ncbi:MAG: hypothetical protein NT028_06520 [candidate division Zixibacteria bacterium]|nr:hypothetical protein [candidate division Zixibacteria bacterium]
MTTMITKYKIFFAYSSNPPTLADAIRNTVPELNKSQQFQATTWEESRIGGKLIIGEICKGISDCHIFVADLTGLNANVMFELGYAIGADKRIFLVCDTTFVNFRQQFERLKLLTTVGYRNCSNSAQIIDQFYREQPWADLETTIYSECIEPNITPGGLGHLLYLKSKQETEASIQITTGLQSSKCPLIIDDPSESTTPTLTWFGVQVANSLGVLCHLTNPEREGAILQTAKQALVAGMAWALKKRLMMLAEGDFLAPVDYRHLLKRYTSAKQAQAHVKEWLPTIEAEYLENSSRAAQYQTHKKLATELSSLRLGEFIAENESAELVDRYFVETSAYVDALSGVHTVFVGRKGSGKTANFLKLAKELGHDKRNLVCIIKPVSYEIQGLVDLLHQYKQRDIKGFAIASLWKFLLVSEIAASLAERFRNMSSFVLDQDQRDYLEFVEKKGLVLQTDFTARLESCITDLTAFVTQANELDTTKARMSISETLHSTLLPDIIRNIQQVLGKIGTICILVDNLDKAWDPETDTDALAQVLLNLLEAARKLPTDLSHAMKSKRELVVKLAVFLRSDIFHRVRQGAKEPDKIRYTRLKWNDPSLLMRVIEERFLAAQESPQGPEQLWSDFICTLVAGQPTRDFIHGMVLPRPRDLIFFMSAAIATAVNRRHTKIQEDDFVAAARQYSQYALESVAVEGSVNGLNMESVLYEFAGSMPVLSQSEVYDRLRRAQVTDSDLELILDYLCGLTFLGPEVGDDEFSYSDDPPEHQKIAILSRNYAEAKNIERRFEIHPAFRPFLEID